MYQTLSNIKSQEDVRESNQKNISYRGEVLKKLSDFYRQKYSASLADTESNERTPVNYHSDQMQHDEENIQ